MATTTPQVTERERQLLDAARGGDDQAFGQLVEPHRNELHAHCYRMLGSTYDAEDALQDAMLRAWRGVARFEGRASLRSWLYTIATNTCLNEIAKRPKRVLPVDYGPATDPHVGPGAPVVETVWVEPYPDERLAVDDGYAAPEARFERREGIELAFIAALQHLPATQRAVLILREVLGYSAKETAEMLETTTASVNSAMQRARAAVEQRMPDQSQQATLRALGDERVREIVDDYVEAWLEGDVQKVASMLAEDACFAMPPLASWFHGRDEIREFLLGYPMSGTWRWRTVRSHANGQPAIAFYIFDPTTGDYQPFALNVLTFRGELISDVVAFVVRRIDTSETAPGAYERWPDREPDARRLAWTFERFGLPDRLDAGA